MRLRRPILLVLASCTGVVGVACFSSSGGPAGPSDVDASVEVGSDDAVTGPDTRAEADGAIPGDATAMDQGTPADASPDRAGEAAGDAGPVDAGTEAASEGSAPVDAGCAANRGPGTFSCTGSLSVARSIPGGAALANGTALVAGGWNTSGTLKSAEIYDPAAGTFSPTGPMSGEHLWAGWGSPWAVLDNGQVLAAGGTTATGGVLTTAELYDPVPFDGSSVGFSATGPLQTGVIAFSEVKLADGSVLLIGGFSVVSSTAPTPSFTYTGGTSAVQRFDPSTGTFGSGGTLAEARLYGCNVVLPSGSVLAIGGFAGVSTMWESNIEEYNATTKLWTTVGTLGASGACSAYAFNVPGGKVLLDSSVLLDPVQLTTTPTTNTPSLTNPTLVQLANGDVLAYGGTVGGVLSPHAQVYKNGTGQWTDVGDAIAARQGSRALLLSSGDVLIVGGADAAHNPLSSAEIYHP